MVYLTFFYCKCSSINYQSPWLLIPTVTCFTQGPLTVQTPPSDEDVLVKLHFSLVENELAPLDLKIVMMRCNIMNSKLKKRNLPEARLSRAELVRRLQRSRRGGRWKVWTLRRPRAREQRSRTPELLQIKPSVLTCFLPSSCSYFFHFLSFQQSGWHILYILYFLGKLQRTLTTLNVFGLVCDASNPEHVYIWWQ